MKIRYLPRLALERDALAQAVGKKIPGDDGLLRVADVDEDAATMAVEAVRELLRRSGTDVADAGRVVLGGDADAADAGLVGRALFGHEERVVPGGPDAEAGDVLVRIQLVRPTGSQLLVGRSAYADAWVGDDQDGDLHEHDPGGTLVLEPDTGRLDSFARAEAEAPRAVPMGASVSEPTWRAAEAARFRLEVGRCAEGHAHFPPRRSCPACGAASQPLPAPRTGRVHTFTRIAPGGGPTEFDFLAQAWGTYASLVAEPDGLEGVRIPGLLTDADPARIEVGSRVEAVFRRIYATEGRWRHGTKFRPTSP